MPPKGKTQSQLNMPRDMRKGESLFLYNLRTGALDPDRLRAKGKDKLADQLTKQTNEQIKRYERRKLKRDATKQKEMTVRKMYEITGNSERDVYDTQKQLIFNDYRKYPHYKFTLTFFGLENDEVEPFVTFPLDFKEIIERGLNHHSISCFKKVRRFQFDKFQAA